MTKSQATRLPLQETRKRAPSLRLICLCLELMASHSYVVVADFHTRADAIEAMKQVVAEVTAASLDEEG